MASLKSSSPSETSSTTERMNTRRPFECELAALIHSERSSGNLGFLPRSLSISQWSIG